VPRPGISTFQRTFFASLHSTGGLAVADAPVFKGPRHCPQKLSPGAAEMASDPAAITVAAMTVEKRLTCRTHPLHG
jgi:hypothetical protein